jgi:hypothetical protein
MRMMKANSALDADESGTIESAEIQNAWSIKPTLRTNTLRSRRGNEADVRTPLGIRLLALGATKAVKYPGQEGRARGLLFFDVVAKQRELSGLEPRTIILGQKVYVPTNAHPVPVTRPAIQRHVPYE